MTRQFNVVVERDAEGFFLATVPNLRGCHTRVREAIELDFVGLQRVCVEA